MRPRNALMLLSMVAVGAAARPPLDDDRLVVITAHYANRAELQRIASHFEHLLVDPRRHTIRTEATHDELMALRRAGTDARIDDAATLQLRAAESSVQRGGAETGTIGGFPCYRTVDETYATMDQLAQAHPSLAQVVDIGPSWLAAHQSGAGHRMRVLRLTNAATDARYPHKPDMVVFASIHAREYTPAELLTRFAESLVAGYDTDDEATWLLDNFRFHLVLQANPDGRVMAEQGASWRKNVDNNNGSCSSTTYGIDLNRNFVYRWNTVADGSSGDPCASTYRGPQARSENETTDLTRYLVGTNNGSGVFSGGVFASQVPVTGNLHAGQPARVAARATDGMLVDLHSYGKVVLWPWAYTTAPAPDALALQTFGRRIAWFNGYRPEQWSAMYAADGSSTDTLYGLLGTPAYTIELGDAFFESCTTFQDSILPDNLAALRYMARNLAAPLQMPSGPDTSVVHVSPTTVAQGVPVTVTATVDDSRYSQANGSEPVQAITSARAYVDQRPWVAAAHSRPMAASDGVFNSSSEAVTVVIPTSGLSRGRHVVAVRGRDASGHDGTPNAAYFIVQ